MSLFVVTEQDGCLIVTLPRECSNFDEEEIRAAEEHVLRAVAEMAELRGVIADMSRTEFLGTLLIETLLRIAKRAAERGGKLYLVGLHGPVKEVFHTTRLDRVLPQAESLEAAIATVNRETR